MDSHFEEKQKPGAGEKRKVGIPDYGSNWDRHLNVYNISELPELPMDTVPGDGNIPAGLLVLRSIFIDAAESYASEIWFDFNFSRKADGKAEIEIFWDLPAKKSRGVKIPGELFFDKGNSLGVLEYLLTEIIGQDGDGVFTINVRKFNDLPPEGHGSFDHRGRYIPPKKKPVTENNGFPGFVETSTIRAFRLSLKGNNIPDDLVIQICPRFWHMPTGFKIE